MTNQFLVEVERHGGLFEARIVDLIDEVGSLLKVVYKRYHKNDEIVSLHVVKLPWICKTGSFEKGQAVEVYFLRGDVGPYGPGWWPAIVSGRKSTVSGHSSTDKYAIRLKNVHGRDICLDRKYIRSPNQNSHIDALCKFLIVVPEQFKYLVTQFSILKQFQTLTGIPFCEYIPEESKLKIICFMQSRSKATLEKEVCCDFMNLCKVLIKSSTNHDEQSKTEMKDAEESDSSVSERVTELKQSAESSMGVNGSAIRQVRSISGVTRVRYDEKTGIFKISGQSSRIVIARNLLKYHEETIEMPQDFVHLLVYDNGDIMRKIINKTELISIEIEDRRDPKLPNITLLLVGTGESITETKFLIYLLLTGWNVKKAIANQQELLPPVDEPTKDMPTLIKPDFFHDEVRIREDIVPLVKDQKEINIHVARKFHDIITIEEDTDDEFLQIDIFGKTQSVVSEARKLLDFVEDSSYHIPPRLVGKVIGKGGQNVRDILQRTDVVRMDVLESKPRSSDGKIPVRLIGLSAKIKKAKQIIKDVINE